MSEYVVTSQKQSQREQPTVPVLNVPNTIEWEPLNGSLHGDLAEVFTPDALSDTSQPEIVLSHLKKNLFILLTTFGQNATIVVECP